MSEQRNPATPPSAQQQEGLDATVKKSIALKIVTDLANEGMLDEWNEYLKSKEQEAYQRGVEAERERCLRIVETGDIKRLGEGEVRIRIAAAIRSGASSDQGENENG